jgi:ribonuclease E
VNSGTFRADNNAEETAFQMNMIAAKEIARQLRLRDLGGVIVNDFIDMRSETHRRRVEDTLRDSLLRDKARTKILRISQFGIIEMTRQRLRPSLKKRIYNECTHCKGTGFIKTSETTGIEVMRILRLAAHRASSGGPGLSTVNVTVHPDAAFYILNRKRREIADLETKANVEIVILASPPSASPDVLEVKCLDANGNEVRLLHTGPPPRVFNDRGGRGGRGGRYPQPIE